MGSGGRLMGSAGVRRRSGLVGGTWARRTGLPWSALSSSRVAMRRGGRPRGFSGTSRGFAVIGSCIGWPRNVAGSGIVFARSIAIGLGARSIVRPGHVVWRAGSGCVAALVIGARWPRNVGAAGGSFVRPRFIAGRGHILRGCGQSFAVDRAAGSASADDATSGKFRRLLRRSDRGATMIRGGS